MNTGQRLGESAEQHAAAFLASKGLSLISRNFRCRRGEIDLVMTDGETLVFVEVRLRRNTRFATPLATVDQRKQRKLMLTAAVFLKIHPQLRNQRCRFDVIAYDGDSQASAEPRWIKQAFENGQ